MNTLNLHNSHKYLKHNSKLNMKIDARVQFHNLSQDSFSLKLIEWLQWTNSGQKLQLLIKSNSIDP